MSRRYPSEQNSGMSNHGNMKTQEMLEEENDQLMEQMASRVKTLKAVSINIGDEVRGQNQFLGGMGEDFDTAGGLLGGSMKRIKGLAAAGHNRWMCYMILFILVVFLICYYLMKWRT